MADGNGNGNGDRDGLHVVVAWSPGPRQVTQRSLSLPLGATVGQAIDACACWDEAARSAGGEPGVFVWGRAARPAQLLQDGDRVELLRGLRVDPKVARRERFARQGARATGLFALKNKAARTADGKPDEAQDEDPDDA